MDLFLPKLLERDGQLQIVPWQQKLNRWIMLPIFGCAVGVVVIGFVSMATESNTIALHRLLALTSLGLSAAALSLRLIIGIRQRPVFCFDNTHGLLRISELSDSGFRQQIALPYSEFQGFATSRGTRLYRVDLIRSDNAAWTLTDNITAEQANQLSRRLSNAVELSQSGARRTKMRLARPFEKIVTKDWSMLRWRRRGNYLATMLAALFLVSSSVAVYSWLPTSQLTPFWVRLVYYSTATALIAGLLGITYGLISKGRYYQFVRIWGDKIELSLQNGLFRRNYTRKAISGFHTTQLTGQIGGQRIGLELVNLKAQDGAVTRTSINTKGLGLCQVIKLAESITKALNRLNAPEKSTIDRIYVIDKTVVH